MGEFLVLENRVDLSIYLIYHFSAWIPQRGLFTTNSRILVIAAGTKLIAVSLMDLTEDIEDLLSASFRSFCFSASCFLK